MPEKHVVILANSVRAKKYCVAGKEVFQKAEGQFDVGRWIRFADPSDTQGAVSYGSTVCSCSGSNRAVRTLDIVKVTFTEPCGNPDHPEDWFFDPKQRWQVVASATHENLSQLQDIPSTLWHAGSESGSVPAGYVRQMGENAASLYLLKAPQGWNFTFWKEQVPDYNNPGQMKLKQHRDLSFQYGGRYHDFSVTDPSFTSRHSIYTRMTGMPQLLQAPDSSDMYFCLSLTPEFKNRHYKIGATIFEP